MAFLRQSKFRHVFGQASRKDACYEGFRVTNCAFEGNFIAANKKFIALCVEAGGSGCFMVIPVENVGRLDVNHPKVSGHKEYVLDLQWNPYNDNMIATCAEDGSIKLWDVPDKGFFVNVDDSKALLTLDYHQRRCVQIQWHPIASNILLSVSQDPCVAVWNLDEGEAVVTIEDFPDIIWNASWSAKGDKIVTVCKDKIIRIFDARSGKLLVSAKGHEGSKSQRAIFVYDDKYIFTTGFSKMSERQYAMRDANTLEELNIAELDTANGVLIPYYDPSSQMVYIAAKGDSVIRYYELVDSDPYFHYITTFQSNSSQRGLAHIPKRSVNPNICEVMKFYKLHGSAHGYLEPISFTVPRKSELYQDDLYPLCTGDEPAIEASDWAEGKDAPPNLIDMKQFFLGKSTKTGGSGGLKKGGLKGLKAKKEAKAAAKPSVDKSDAAPAAPAPTKTSTPPPAAKEPSKESGPASRTSTPSAQGAQGGSGVDEKVVKDLKNEIQTLKDSEKKLQKEVKSLTDKLKDYDKLTADIKILCDAVKKNDERITALEGLVEESEEEN